MKNKWSPGKIVAVVLGSVGAGIVLLVTLYIGVFRLTRGLVRFGADVKEARQGYGQSQRDEKDTQEREERIKDWLEEYGDSYDDSDRSQDDRNDLPDKEAEDERGNVRNRGEYYEFHDEIRKDLSYQVEVETSNRRMGENDNIVLALSYPVVTGGNEAVLEGINDIIQREIREVEQYGESVDEWITEEENFVFEAESYVTYMDENILSVVYMEYGYLNDETYESYIVSVNIDMESGMALPNTQLLDIDDDFSIDFRKRCEKQNGEIDSISFYSDQDITYMLSDDSSLIIFYTPLGMEVGFNYYYGWVTVTYQDYQKYQSRF